MTDTPADAERRYILRLVIGTLRFLVREKIITAQQATEIISTARKEPS